MSIVGGDLIESTSTTVDSKSSDKTMIVAKGDLEQKGANVSVAADQKKSLSCVDLEQSAQSSSKLTSSNVAVEGQAAVEVKGAKVDITGSGPANVKGNPLSLN
jgi:hypothetical protein